jgi:hypothetical protein
MMFPFLLVELFVQQEAAVGQGTDLRRFSDGPAGPVAQ